MEAKKPRKPNWDDPSMQVLCDGVERRIATIKGRFSPSLTQEKKQAAWASVTACVNAVTFGCTRTIDEVKKRWQDAQSAVKKKESTRLKKAAGTGGGPVPQIYFKCWERIVLRTMSPTSISGLEGGVDTAESQILESSMLSESEHDTCPPHEYDNDVCEIANGDSCVPVVGHIENETATCSESFQGETTPAEDQSETMYNKGARRKKRTGHIEIATSSVSCQGDTTSAEDATERTHRVGPKRKAEFVKKTMAKHGIFPIDGKKFSPHITVMNMNEVDYHFKKAVGRSIKPDLYHAFLNTPFGREPLSALQLCAMGVPKDERGYYPIAHTVTLHTDN